MKIAVLSPIAWRTPPKKYGPWEKVASLITEGLVKRGHDVTLFATGNSITKARLESVVEEGYEETNFNIKVWEGLHIAQCFEKASEFDIIHNHFDFLPLTYTNLINTPVVTTIHGFSSEEILPVYEKYNDTNYYVSISFADRREEFNYTANIYHGIEVENYQFEENHGQYLLTYGRIDNEKGVHEAIKIANEIGMPLKIAGLKSDPLYFAEKVEPYLEKGKIEYVGNLEFEEGNELLKNAYALLHLINFDEAFGLSVVEALACGTPVIAIDRGSMSEIIKNGETGFLVRDINEAVEAVNKIQSIERKRCRMHVEKNFSVDRMIEDYINLYKKIVEDEKEQ